MIVSELIEKLQQVNGNVKVKFTIFDPLDMSKALDTWHIDNVMLFEGKPQPPFPQVLLMAHHEQEKNAIIDVIEIKTTEIK